MANEITIGVSLSATKGYLSVSKQVSGLKATLTGDAYSAQSQTIGTTYEVLDISGDLSSKGWAYFRNLDDTNYVEVGTDAGADLDPVFRLNAGEVALMRLSPSVAFYAKANTAAVILEYCVLEA